MGWGFLAWGSVLGFEHRVYFLIVFILFIFFAFGLHGVELKLKAPWFRAFYFKCLKFRV